MNSIYSLIIVKKTYIFFRRSSNRFFCKNPTTDMKHLLPLRKMLKIMLLQSCYLTTLI